MGEPYNYRLAVDADGNHGYEVGAWPQNADMNNPSQYVVVAKCYTQAEAAALAAAHSAGGGGPEIEPPAAGTLHRHDLEAMTKDELITQANERDLEIGSHATKADIIDAIIKHQRASK